MNSYGAPMHWVYREQQAVSVLRLITARKPKSTWGQEQNQGAGAHALN